MTIVSSTGHRPYRKKLDIDLRADRAWWIARRLDAITTEDANFAAMRLAQVEREIKFRGIEP